MKSRLLLCCGDYPFVMVLHALQLQVLFRLVSRSYPNFLANLLVFTRTGLNQDVVLGVSVAGVLTLWTLTGREDLDAEVNELESRVLSSISVIHQIAYCTHSPRCLLLVYSSEWKILDAVDCSVLIVHQSPAGVCLVGGDFLKRDFIIIYTSSGEALILKLPDDLLSRQYSPSKKDSIAPEVNVIAIFKFHKDTLEELAKDRPLPANAPYPNAVDRSFCIFASPQLVADVHGTSRILVGAAGNGSLFTWRFSLSQLLHKNPLPSEICPLVHSTLARPWHRQPILDLHDGLFSRLASLQVNGDPEPSLHHCGSLSISSCLILHTTPSTSTPGEAQTIQVLQPFLALGLISGHLLVLPLLGVLQCLHPALAGESSLAPSPCLSLPGHRGPVLVLLHPFSSQPSHHFPATLLLSAGADFCVRIWNLNAGGRFQTPVCLSALHIHSSPVIGLFVAPPLLAETRQSSLASLIVSVGTDGTAGLFRINDGQVLFRANTLQSSRIRALAWRIPERLFFLLDDDYSLTVWDLASHRLERQETGKAALDLFRSGSHVTVVDWLPDWTFDAHTRFAPEVTSPPAESVDSTSSFKQLASLDTVVHTRAPSLHFSGPARQSPTNLIFQPPVLLQRVGTTDTLYHLDASIRQLFMSPAAVVFVFDIDAIIRNVTSLSHVMPSDLSCTQRKTPKFELDLYSCGQLMRYLVELLQPWVVDAALESRCRSLYQLSPSEPDSPGTHLGDAFCIASLSEAGCLTLPFPGRGTGLEHFRLTPRITTTTCLTVVSLMEAACSLSVARSALIFAFPHHHHHHHQQPGSSIQTTPHFTSLHTISALIGKAVCLNFLQLLSPRPEEEDAEQAQLHTALASLIAYWQTENFKVRYAARSLIYSLFDEVGLTGRQTLLKYWLSCLPQQEKPNSCTEPSRSGAQPVEASLHSVLKAMPLVASLFGGLASGGSEETASLLHSAQLCAVLMVGILSSRFGSNSHLPPEVIARDICPETASPVSTFTDGGLQVCEKSEPLGLAVANFGSNEEPIRSPNQASQLVGLLTASVLPPALSTNSVSSPDLNDYESLRVVASFLEDILFCRNPFEWDNQKEMTAGGLQTSLIPNDFYSPSPLRRMAIDILSRGFTVWEPFVDSLQLLNALLTLSADAEALITKLEAGCAVNGPVDLARSARQGLWAIMYARPKLVILSFSLMLRRLHANNALEPLSSHNHALEPSLRVVMSSPALATPIVLRQSAPNVNATGQLPASLQAGRQLPLLRARLEVLCLIEDMCIRRPQYLLPVLPELLDVVLVCVDKIRLKERGLNIAFPALRRFNSISSHTRNQKVCVGGLGGTLTFFDFKNGRYFSADGHSGAVTSTCFSPDGRQLASYSINENKLRIWQLSTSGLFGMGGQQVKAISVHPVPPLVSPRSPGKSEASILDPHSGGSLANQLRLASLTWRDSNTVQVANDSGLTRLIKV